MTLSGSMAFDHPAPPSGRLSMRVYRLGFLVDAWDDDNLIVSGAATVNSQLLGGSVAGNSITTIGFGTNLAAAAPGNVALAPGAYFKGIDAVTYPSPGQVAFGFSLSVFEANGQTIAEYGLLTAGGTLYARLVRAAPLLKDLSMSLSSTWTVSF